MLLKTCRSIMFKILRILNSRVLKNQVGMSLIEIMIVITLIALVGAMVAGRVLDQLDKGKYTSAKVQLQSIASKLEDYKLRCGEYPESLEKMKAGGGSDACENFPKQGFLKENEMKDPWKNTIVYSKEGSEYKLMTYGADKAEGGDGYNKDISSDDTQ